MSMDRSILIFPITLFLLVSLSCERSGTKSGGTDDKASRPEAKETFLQGRIENPPDSFIQVYPQAMYRYRMEKFELDSTGRFEGRLELRHPQFLTFGYGYRRSEFFVQPGDSVVLKGNMKNIDDSLEFMGGSEVWNDAMVDWRTFRDSVEDTLGNLYKAGPMAFKEKMDSLRDIEKSFWDSVSREKELPDAFMKGIKSFMTMKGAYTYFYYPNYHKRIADQDSIDLPDSFYDPIHRVELDRSENRFLPLYDGYAKNYAEHLMKERIEADSSLADSAELPFKYRIYKEKVDDDTLRAYFLGDLLLGNFQRPGDRDVKGLMKEVQELPLPSHLKDSLKQDRKEWKKLLPGRKSPGFAYPNIDGDTVSLADLEGDYVLVDTWASWCGPCKKEIPHLEELQERFSDANISFVSISLDEKKTREDWEKMVKEKELKGHQLIANGEGFDSDFAEDHMISSIPRFLLFDPEGRIVDADAERPSRGLGERLDTLLDESPS